MKDKEKLKDCILESRVFSNGITSESLQVRQFSQLNLNQLIRYLRLPPHRQLRVLVRSIGREMKKKSMDKERYEIIENFFLSEIARLITVAKNEMRTEGGTIATKLKFSIYGGEIMKSARKLNRYLVLANKSQESRGTVPLNVQKGINENYSDLINTFRENYLVSKFELPEDEDADVSLFSDTSQVIETNLEIKEILNKLSDEGITRFKIQSVKGVNHIKIKEEIDSEYMNKIKSIL